MYEFLRILPMSVADLLNEWFETDVLKASLAASGMLGSFVGPRHQGTSFVFLYHQLGESNGALRTSGFVRGGIGNLAMAISRAAQRFGAKIRTEVEVTQILAKNGAATGVILGNGEEISERQLFQAPTLRGPFFSWLSRPTSIPSSCYRLETFRSRGTVGQNQLCVDTLPKFNSAQGQSSWAIWAASFTSARPWII